MKVLITGGTGLVGKEIGKRLAQKGHTLFVLTRSREKAEMECPFPQTPVTWDELETSPDMESLDAIINLAGAGVADKRWTKAYKKQIYDSRVKGTERLVELANSKCKQLKAFISTSAIGVYGEADDSLADENANKSYEFLGSLCQDWEAPIANLTEARGVILRVGLVFSEKGGTLEKMVPPIQGRFGGALGNGKQYMSWIDIDDLANMFIFALENNISGVYNATAPNPETNKEITKKIADHLGVGVGPSVPYFAIRLAIGEMAPHIVESQRISPAKIQNKGFQFECKDVIQSIEKRVPKLKGMERRLIYEQWIPKTKEEVFTFFAEARNLEQITPPSLNFKILDVNPDPIEGGSIINYKLKIDGIPVKWRTLIKDWNPPHMFSDNQEKGPYKKWYHIHTFEELAGGTLMTDQIDMILPLGPLGYGLAGWKVFRDVRNIFKFRKEVIKKLF